MEYAEEAHKKSQRELDATQSRLDEAMASNDKLEKTKKRLQGEASTKTDYRVVW